MIRRWRDIERWIETDEGQARISQYPLVPLADVLAERREPIQLPDGGLGDWQAITIKFTGEVLPRERTTAFKGAMFAAYAGDLVFSKIDARNGAIGLIPHTIPKAVVTTEYPVFTPRPEVIRADYLHYLLRAEHFKADLQRRASGTSGRKRVTPAAFVDLKVPLPSLEEQDALIQTYGAALERAVRLEQEADAIEREGWRAFEAALGLAPPPPLPDRPMFVANFSDLERWSHEGALRATANQSGREEAKNMVLLGCWASVSYGLQKSPANRPGSHARPYLRVANVQRGFLDLKEIKYINVPEEDMPRLRLEHGDVLLCEGNSAELVGRGAIWRGEIEDCVHQNHVLRVRVNPDKLLAEFVLSVINSSHGQAYFRSKAKRTTNLASINSKEVAALPVPDVAVTEQKLLLCDLHAQTARAESTRSEARQIRQSAWAAFESSLFAAPRPSVPSGGATEAACV